MTATPKASHGSLDPRHLLRAIERRGLAGTAALVLSVIACYGTLVAVAALSALGVTLAVNTGIWAGAIVLFALLATAIIALGIRKHGSAAPLLPALAGTALLGYVMFGRFDRLLELAGFALLATAVFWDFRLRSRASAKRAGGAGLEHPT
jgi:arsenite methyltransferase